MFISDLNNRLQNQAKFSMNELIPVMEKRMTQQMNYPYVIRPWIYEELHATKAKLCYIAFPEGADKNLFPSFSYNNKKYIYEVIDRKHAKFYLANNEDLLNLERQSNYLQTLLEGNLAFIITEQTVEKIELLRRLISDSNEDYYLWKDIFKYPEELEFLNSSIEDFAKQKVKTPE